MSEGDAVYTKNQDGSISVQVEGVKSDYVLKTDLVNVKTASESARKEHDAVVVKHNTDIAEANRVKDETHTKLVQEQARSEQLTKDTQDTANLRTKVGELETEKTTLTDTNTGLSTELLTIKRSIFGEKYKVDKEKVEAMTLDQLTEAEKNFLAVGFNPNNPKPANYDTPGGVGSGAGVGKTVLEGCADELKIAKEMRAKRFAGVIDPDDKP